MNAFGGGGGDDDDVEQLALESPSVCQQQLHPVGAFALRMNLFEPARSHQLSKPACIVLVGLVALGVQHAGCVMGLQQHHRDAVLLQLAVQPGRPTGRLVADEQQPVRIRLKRLPDRFGVGGHTGLQRDLAVLGFDDADRSCGGGSVECGMVLHRGASSLAGCNNTPTLRLPVHHGEIARRWPNYAVNPPEPLLNAKQCLSMDRRTPANIARTTITDCPRKAGRRGAREQARNSTAQQARRRRAAPKLQPACPIAARRRARRCASSAVRQSAPSQMTEQPAHRARARWLLDNYICRISLELIFLILFFSPY